MRITKISLTTLACLALLAGCEDSNDDMMTADGGGTTGTMGGDGGPTTGSDGSMTDDDSGSTGGTPMARGADNPPTPGDQIDRVGRAAISTALQATFSADEDEKGDAKDLYNMSTPADASMFTEGFAASLAILDALDGTCGNQLLAGDPGEGRYDMLAGVLANDQLVVNTTSGTCGVYLGAEAEFVGALPAGDGGCGGRTPLDDVVERSYSVLAAGALSGVDDTITEDDAEHDPTSFPFLAAPTL